MPNDFTHILLQWFHTNGRHLPWRETNDPYRIWLSEIILQQTRIQQGEAYWHRFVNKWPTVETLAAATEDEVLRLWQGLGYYSRARNLYAAARQIVQIGHFPTTYHEIRQLKGVGDYTAAAIASFAFNIPVAAVDGNVFRVLSRCFGIDTPINTAAGKKLFTALAQQLLPESQPADFNQAMMDFGATQCTPKSPDCLSCPMLELCEAARAGTVNRLPVKLNTVKVRQRHFAYCYFRFISNGQTFTAIRRRPAGDIWQGLWEPFLAEEPDRIPHFNGALTLLRQNVRHVLTHQVILADFYLLETNQKPTLPADFIWIPESDIDRYALPRLVELLIQTLP